MKKENENKKLNNKSGIIALLVVIAMALITINACGFFNSSSWYEEVLLHDGTKIYVKRWQKRMGVHEPGMSSPVGEQSIKFKLPGTQKVIKWRDEYSRDIGRSNFKLLALHIINSTPYIITKPRLCLSYNKWGRPNPPYVIFKFDGKDWKRIELAELPLEFKNINMVIESEEYDEKLVNQSLVSAEMVQKLNRSMTQKEFKTIIRTPLERVGCPDLATNGKGRWVGIGFFKKASYEECLAQCKMVFFDAQHCPCDRLFKNNSKEK